MNLKYPILQSGFLALSQTGLTQKQPENASFAATILFTPINREYDNLFYNQDVSVLFQEWQANFHLIRKFEFQERVLKQAMLCFGPSILDWLAFQEGKPDFSATHKQFLVKMIPWLLGTLETPDEAAESIKWVGLLGPSEGHSVRFNTASYPGLSDVATTEQAICNWVAKESGYESLLVHLYVIFGQRVGHVQKPSMG